MTSSPNVKNVPAATVIMRAALITLSLLLKRSGSGRSLRRGGDAPAARPPGGGVSEALPTTPRLD